MNFSGFYGNEPIKKALNTHFFHAYLIEGPTGSGKHTLADKITHALVCEAENPPCGICRQCYKVQQNCHPDVIDIPADLPVEQLRQVLAEIILKPNDAKHKVYRIDCAEKLLPAAQNLLLKTLEEPPVYAFFILICNAKEGLLPTVRSRCQLLSLAPLPEELMAEYFQKTFGRYDEKTKAAIRFSAGILGKALEYYNAEEDMENQACARLEQALLTGDKTEVFRVFSFKTREELSEFHAAFSLHIKDRVRNGSNDTRSFFTILAYRWDKAGEAIQTNVNVKFWNTNLARLCLKAREEAK